MRWIKTRIFIFMILISLIYFCIYLYSNFGFLQKNKINEVDRERWTYKNGIIVGAEEFYFQGSETCWVLIHGYTSTPAELKQLGEKLHVYFNDSVYGVRLSGHGRLPRNLLGLNLDKWYQSLEEIITKNLYCKQINIVGSSFGGTLALQLAIDYKLGNIYLISPYISMVDSYKEILAAVFSNVLNYEKKMKPGLINDPEGSKNHIGYMVLPIRPFVESLSFVKAVKKNLHKINERVVVQHSLYDSLVDPAGTRFIDNSIKKSKVIWYKLSDHLLLMDFDRISVVNNILAYEGKNRINSHEK